MTAEAQDGWRRTSPTAVVIFLGRAMKTLVTQGAAALFPLIAVFATVDGLRWYWLPIAALPFAGLLLLWSVLSYLRFQFRVEDGLIVLRQGVLKHEQLTIEFARVQNVSIHEPFYMRPLGLAVLDIDTAGSQGSEITLGGIRRSLAETLRTEILADAAIATTDVTGAGSETAGGASRVLIERTTKQIARHGLTASGLFWVFIVFGFLAGLGGGNWLAEAMKMTIEFLIGEARKGNVLLLSAIAAGAVLAVLMVPVASMAGALIRYHGYRLSREGESYRRSSGLIDRREEALKQHKIQSVVWRQNGIARLLGIVTLKLEVARSGDPQVDASGLPMGMRSSFLVPALEPEEARALVAEFLPDCDAASVEFSRPDAWRCVGRPLLLFFTAPILVVTLPAAAFLHWLVLLAIPVLYVGPFLLLRQTWSRHGYAVRGGYGFVRSGFLGLTTAIFPLFKIQRVDVRQTPGQRRRKLAHVTLHLASRTMTVPNVVVDDAHLLQDLALYHTESTRRAWF